MLKNTRTMVIAPVYASAFAALVACGGGANSSDGGDEVTTEPAEVTTGGAPTSGEGDAEAGSSSGDAGETGAVTGGESEDGPDYDQAFPQDRVVRLDITIAPEDWQAMLADMTDMAGEFGAGMGIGGMDMPPMPDPTACAGLTAGAACESEFMGEAIVGACTDFMGTLVCVPEGGMGMDPGMGGTDFLPRTPIYVECDVTEGSSTWGHVGIRFKGNSSLSTAWSSGVYKMPLRLNFDKFEDQHPDTKNQRYHGFDSLSLSNGAMDASLLRDKLGTDVFADAGLPAPATAFYRIFIDHGEGPVYFGLYTGIELPDDDSFLDRSFGGHKGNLYKPDGAGARWDVWDPETLGKENNEDAADYSDAKALFDALHGDDSDAAAWRAGLAAVLDVDGFLHWLALNAVVQDWDVYGRMAHNYFLYADENDGGRFQWIPWDHSFAFTGGDGGMFGQSLSLGMDEVGAEWPLIRLLLDDPTYSERYAQFVAQAAEIEYTPADMSPRFTAAHHLIAPYVIGAEGELPGYTFVTSDADFTAALDQLLLHVEQRQQEVAEFLGP